MILEDLGFAVTEVEDPHRALDRLESGGSFDLIVTDILMPGMDGWTLAERVRESRPSVPVLYISGFSSDAVRPVEGSRILWKPFGEKSVTKALLELLEPDRTGHDR
jgi:CheY-like chemotaxis protein